MGLFAHYQAEPGAIRGAGDDLVAGSKRVTAVKTDVVQQQQSAMSAVSGTLLAPLSSAAQPVETGATNVAQAATVASGALDMFARAVDEFNLGIDRLNEQYEAAKATNFGVDASQFYEHGAGMTADQRADAYHSAVVTAGNNLRATLAAEERKLKEVLDSEAEAAAAILTEGPSDAALLALVMNGALPAQAKLDFPDFFKKFENDKFVYDRATNLYGLYGIAKNISGLRDKVAFNRATLALLQGKNLANAELRVVLKFAGGNMDDVRVIEQIARRTEALAPLRTALGATRDFDLLDAATATSKFSKALGVLGIAGSIYDIGWNPAGHTGVRRVTDVSADLLGGGAALGGLAVAAGVISAPVAGPIILAAGAVATTYAATMFVADHWDDIESGVSTAANWTADQFSEGVEEAGEAVSDAKDWVEDKAEDIPVIGGLF